MGAASDTCSECGAQQPVSQGEDSRSSGGRKHPVLAAILSLLIPGIGQLYVERIARTVGFLLAWALVVTAPETAEPATIVLKLTIVAMAAVDAAAQAREVNQSA